MSELQGMSVMAGYFAVLWLTWFILWARAQDKSRKLRDELGAAREAVDDLLHESQSLRADLAEYEVCPDIEVEMDLSEFDRDEIDEDDGEEWKRG